MPCLASALPTPVDPVKVSLRSRPSSISAVGDVTGLGGRQHRQHTLGQAGLVHQLGQQQHGQRRLLRGLDDHGAAGGHRRADLAGAHGQREVPRRDRVARADGLLGDDDAPGARGRRRVAAADAHRLLGEPAEELGAVLDLAHALGEHLAHLQRHQRREVVGARGDRLEDRTQDLAALPGGRRRPLGLHGAAASRAAMASSAVASAMVMITFVGGRVENVERRRAGRALHRRSTARWGLTTAAVLSVSIPPSCTPSGRSQLGSNDMTKRHFRHPPHGTRWNRHHDADRPRSTSASSSPTTPTAAGELTLTVGDLYIDYSKHRVTRETLRLLVDLADAADLEEPPRRDVRRRAHQHLRGPRRAAHRAAAAARTPSLTVDGQDVVADVHEVLDAMGDFTDRLRRGEWRGATGERDHDRRQHRHRRLRPRPGDGVPGAAALRRRRHLGTVRLQRRPGRPGRQARPDSTRPRRCSSSPPRRSRRWRR